MDEHEAPDQLDPRLALDFLRRRWLIMTAVALPALIGAIIYPLTLSNVYEGEAKLAIEGEPEVMDLGRDFMPADGGFEGLIALGMSDSVLGRVIDLLPAPGVFGDDEVTPAQWRKMRIGGLRRAIALRPDGGGTLLTIAASSRNPRMAAFIANGVADAIVAHKREKRESASRRAFTWLDSRTYELRDKIERRAEALHKLVTDTGVNPAEANRDPDRETKAQLMASLQASKIELLTIEQRLVSILPGRLLPQFDEDASRLRERYVEARAAHEAARLRYTRTHPEVQRQEEILAELEARLGDDIELISSPELVRERRRLEGERSQLRARVDVLERALNEFSSAEVPSTSAVSAYQRLERELAIDKQMLQILLMRRNETLHAAAAEHVGAEVLDYAVEPRFAVGPNRRKLWILGIGASLAAGLGLGLLLEFADRRVRDPEQAAAALGAPVLGLIPMVRDRGIAPERQAAISSGSVVAEAYRNLRTALLFSGYGSKPSRLVVTSALAGEGKTTVASNLAAAFARSGRKVLLVDADLRRSRVHRVFAVERSPGVSEILQGRAELAAGLRRPHGCEFDVLPAGEAPENPSELIGSPRLAELRAELLQRYDLVILDAPVMLSVSDGLLLAASAEGTIIVHKPGGVDKRALERMRSDLRMAGANVLGVVFNQVDRGDRYAYPLYMESPYVKEAASAGGAGADRAGSSGASG